MIIHLVTDRRRVAGADDRTAGQCRGVVELVERAIEAGVDAVQVRERDLEGGALTALTAELVARAAGSRTRIIVNDRLDVALAAGAHGVHLRAESIPAAAARAMAPAGFLIGRSVHSAAEAERVGSGVDYLIAGTVWTSPSKGFGTTLLGVDGLRAVTQATQVPALAIGGVTLDRVPELARAGARGFAAIGLFASSAARVSSGALAALIGEARRLYERAYSA